LLSGENEAFIDLSLSGRQLFKLHIDFHLCGQSRFFQFIAEPVFLVLFASRGFGGPFGEVLPNLLSLEDHFGEGIAVAPDALFLLIPPPLVDLRLGEAGEIGHLHYLLFGPVGLHLQLLLQDLDLRSALALAFLDPLAVGILVDFSHRLRLPLLARVELNVLQLVVELLLHDLVLGEAALVRHFAP